MKKFIAAVIMIIMATAFANVLASSYVGNANSKKFHYADCSMVNKMKKLFVRVLLVNCLSFPLLMSGMVGMMLRRNRRCFMQCRYTKGI